MMTAGDEAIFDAIVFMYYFADFPDPRQRIKVIYPLDQGNRVWPKFVLTG